jgi:phage gp36-like protein
VIPHLFVQVYTKKEKNMSMQFTAVLEPDVAITERSEIRTDIVAGVTTIPVMNASKFIGNKYLCIGQYGDETAELIKITDTDESERTITIESPTLYSHYQKDPVSQFLYNKRKFYRYNTTTEEYDHLASEGSPKDIEVDNPQGTFFEDSEGTQSNIYKATYLNTAESVESSIDDAIAIAGGGISTDLISLFRIRYSAGFKENWSIEDSYIDQYRQDAQGEAWAALRTRYTFPLTKNSSFLRNIIRDLAVGFIWLDQYAGNAEKVRSAESRIKDARLRLGKLANGTYTLYDEDTDSDQEETGVGAGLSYYPDGTTDDTNDERLFQLQDKF